MRFIEDDIRAGEQVDEFVKSPLGLKLLAECKAKRDEAVAGILSCDPSDSGVVAGFQATASAMSFVEVFFSRCKTDAFVARGSVESEKDDFSF